MGASLRLATASALVRYLAAQRTPDGHPLIGGVFAIFGHGNVAGLGKALEDGTLPVLRAQNESGMGLAATAYAKAHRRRRLMACTSSIGPGATNLVTPAATARVNRLPLLLLPGEAFADRGPDPVLQQLEDDADPDVSVNDCLRPVSRFFARIHRPEQLIPALDRAMTILMDPVLTGPVSLALPQDVQAEVHDFPASAFAPRVRAPFRPGPDPDQIEAAAQRLRSARRPMVVVGGGVRYSGAEHVLARFLTRGGLPAADTHAGRGALLADHPAWVGGLGVTGSARANACARAADLVLGVGTRFTDFTTGSRALFAEAERVHISVDSWDAAKHEALAIQGDAGLVLKALDAALADHIFPEWAPDGDPVPKHAPPPGTDAAVVAAVRRFAGPDVTVVAASGSLPGELQKAWAPRDHEDYHVEYGFSCMGYEVAGGLGVKLARPDRTVVVLVGDGAYLMLSSEVATAVELEQDLIIVLVDNGGFGCIHRLQKSVGGRPYANLRKGAVDFVAHAQALGAKARRVETDLESALHEAQREKGVQLLLVQTDPEHATEEGGAAWRVPSTE
ncbi:MAG: thiamine pyrophosphate-dependent enzyme [Myxococcota bacterium]